jgi:Mor family transcriptional regulator
MDSKHYLKHPIAEAVGIDILEKLIEAFSGETLYIPSLRNYERSKKRKSLLKDFDGRNQRLLAIKYGCSLRRIQQIIKENHEKKRRK